MTASRYAAEPWVALPDVVQRAPTVERFRAGFGAYLRNGYGLTECTAPCASVPPQHEAPVDPVSGSLAVGLPGPDTVVRILDDRGEEVPVGEHGEIAVRGRQVVPGSWRRPEATAEAFPGGELRTGAPYTHPAVREAAVVGAPDAYRGETVKAYVSLRPGADTDADTLAAYRKDRLAACTYPRHVEVLPDLPTTASGKILRRELRSRTHDR